MAVKNVTLNDLGNVLSTPFMMPSSKDLIKSGWRGDIENFSKKLWKYHWPHTRDYTMAVIMLTVVVAARKAKNVIVQAKERDDKGTKGKNDIEISLPEYINQKVSRNKVKELFGKVVNIESSSDSNNIAQSISKQNKPLGGWFAKCFINLLLTSNNDLEKANKVFENFLKQIKKMTKWKINKNYMKELTEIINNALNIHITEPIPETKAESGGKSGNKNATDNNHKTSSTDESESPHILDDEELSKSQMRVCEHISKQCRKNRSPFFEPPKDDKYMQYYLNSYQLEHGTKHRKGISYCLPIVPNWKELKVGYEFKVDKYISCSLYVQNAKMMQEADAVFKIIFSPSDRLLFPHPVMLQFGKNDAEAIVPPHTKFKVTAIEPKEYVIDWNEPITKDTITLEIIGQETPVKPTDSEIDDMVKDSYETSEKYQLSTWDYFIQTPDALVCNGEEEQSEAKKEGNQNTVLLEDYGPQLHYINFLAQMQVKVMNHDGIWALKRYSSSYETSEKNNRIINAIFDKIKPLEKPLIVFRGMDEDEMASIIASYNENKIFDKFLECAKHNNLFLSTSVDPAVSMWYMQHGENIKIVKGKGLLKLTIPPGKKALAAEPTGENNCANYEIMLQREGLKIRVDKITEKGGLSFIEATVV